MIFPDGMTVTVEHCGEPMRYVGAGVRWVGDDEISHARYACRCGVVTTVEVVQDVGPPLEGVFGATTSAA